MAEHIKNALRAAVTIWLVYTGLGPWMKAGSITFQIGSLSTAMSLAVATFATTLVSSVIGGLTSKGINATAGNFGTKFATRAPTAARQIIYGKCRVGGTIVHMETTGVDNYLLHVVVVIAGHEIQSLEGIRINDIDLTTSSSTISGSTVYTVTNSDFSNTENENKYDSNGRLIRYTFQDGSQTGVDGYMDAQLSSMTTSDKFLDCAYVYMQMVFDPEKFGGGMPNLSFIVKGKKVYDPRTDSTAWSENPALCVRDYLTDTTYGLKALSSEINDTTNAGGIAAAANACELDVTLADNSTTEDKYTANGFTNFAATGTGVIEGLLSSMVGKLSYTNGQFNVFAGTTQTPSLTITDDNLLSPINVSTQGNTGELYNTVKPVFVDAANDYIPADAPVYQDSTFLTEDTPNGTTNDKPNYAKQMEKQLPFTTTHTMAQRIGRQALNYQRQSTSISCLVDLSFMRLQPADWVYVTNERLNYTQKIFEVISINLEIADTDDAPALGVRLALKETASSIYAFATSDYAAAIAQGSDLALGSYAMAAPSNLAATTDTLDVDAFNMTSVTITWTNSASPLVTGTEIEYKKNSSSTWLGFNTVGKGVASATIAGGMEMGIQYNFRIRHVGAIGTFSTWSSTYNHTVGGTAVATTTISNSSITVNDTTGIIENIGTGNIKVNNEKITVNNDGKLVGIGTSDIVVDNTELSSSNITGGLGFTPYNASNPSGFTGDQSLPTHTTSQSDPSGSAVVGSTHLKTGVTPQELWIYTSGSGWVHQQVNVDTDTTYVLPTHTSGGGVPDDNTTPSPNPLGSSYRRTTTPNELYISDGSDWILQSVNSDTDTVYTLPDDILKGDPTVDGTTITFTANDGTTSTVVTQDTNTTYTFVDSLTASPSAATVWTSSDGAYYSPSGTTQDVTVTYYNGISTDECVIRWTYVAIAYSTADYILSVVEQTDSNNKFTIGSIDPSSATNRKVATVVVTHTASSETITLTCLISIVGVAGGGK